jgi:hypothetical protein
MCNIYVFLYRRSGNCIGKCFFFLLKNTYRVKNLLKWLLSSSSTLLCDSTFCFFFFSFYELHVDCIFTKLLDSTIQLNMKENEK